MVNPPGVEIISDIRRVAEKLGVPITKLTRQKYRENKSIKCSDAGWAKLREAAADGVKYALQPDFTSHPVVEHSEIPDEVRPVTEIIAARKKEFARRQRRIEASENYEVRVHDDKPIGIWVFGDPHLDDPGCDIELLLDHARKVRETPGLFAAGIGDVTNNWIGRLSRLYGAQGTTELEAFSLAEYWIGEVRDWLFMIAGNHDVWHGESRDPIKWFAQKRNTAYAHEIGLTLAFDNNASFRINARHAFRGHSMWNPAHASTKSVRMEGGDWNVKLSGHTHIAGYNPTWTPDLKRLTHCVQVGSYKQYDSYAETDGFVNNNWTPGAFLLFDPQATNEVDRVHWFPSIDLGIVVLNAMRSRPVKLAA